MRIDAILIRKAKNEIRVSFSNSKKEPNLTQKKRTVINELEAAVELLKGKEVKYGGGSGFDAGFFDLLVRWPGDEANSGGNATRTKSSPA